MIDYLPFNGTEYPVREIMLTEHKVDVMLSVESLQKLLKDEDGEYTSREAQLISEIIFFYVPDELLLTGTDEELELYVTECLDWKPF